MSARERIALLLAVLAFFAVGCGGDEEPVAEETDTTEQEKTEREPKPEQTDRSTATTPTQPTQTTAPPPTTGPAPSPTQQASPPPPPAGGGGGGGGGGGSPADPSKPDGPRNDVPPPEGSPADKFEDFCDQNPEACG